MKSGRRTTSLFACLVAVALLAGCGGGGSKTLSKDEYSKELKKAIAALSTALRPLNQAATAPGYAKLVEQVQPKLRKIADQLDSVNPPKNVEKDNDLLVKSFRALADALTPLKEAAAKKDKAGVQKALRDIQTSSFTRDLQKAVADLTKKGYSLNG